MNKHLRIIERLIDDYPDIKKVDITIELESHAFDSLRESVWTVAPYTKDEIQILHQIIGVEGVTSRLVIKKQNSV